ncbi:MAG: 4-oxalomesaconate tautomerase [Acidimicrobiia bacterium]
MAELVVMPDSDVIIGPVEGVRCMIIRGGTSKGAYFVPQDLPTDAGERDDLLMRIMGTPDPRQIDGLGGAHPLTSKVAIVSRSEDPNVDVEYLFLQIGVDLAEVTDRQNCGNLLAGVGPFAIERGLIEPDDGQVAVVVRMLNTNSVAIAHFRVENGLPVYDGDTSISGVPGTAGPIQIDFEDTAGGSSGSLFPTGNLADVVLGTRVTLVDNGMPVVVLRADSMGVTGYESCAELEANDELRMRLEEIRLESGRLMNLGDVKTTTVPKLTLVAAPKAGGHLCTRTFIPHRCHQAIGVLGAVSVATGSIIDGTVGFEVLDRDEHAETVILEHPTGTFETTIDVSLQDGQVALKRAGIVRTARKLMDGIVFPRPAA